MFLLSITNRSLYEMTLNHHAFNMGCIQDFNCIAFIGREKYYALKANSPGSETVLFSFKNRALQ